MPVNLIKSISSKHGVSEKTLEKYWDEAKKAAKESGRSEEDSRFYGLVTDIFKNKIKKHLDITVENYQNNNNFKRLYEEFRLPRFSDVETKM